MVTTWLLEYRTEALRVVLASVGVGIGLFILFIAIEIAQERGRSKGTFKRRGNIRQSRPRRGGSHERKRENGSGGEEENNEEPETMTEVDVKEFCKELYEEWAGTLIGHSAELKSRVRGKTALGVSEAAIRRFFNNMKREELLINSANELISLNGGSKNGGSGTLSERRRVSIEIDSRNKPTTPTSSKHERKSKSTRLAAPRSRTPSQKRKAAAPTSLSKRPSLSPTFQRKKVTSPASTGGVTPAQKRRTNLNSTISGKKRRSSTSLTSEVKVGRKGSLQQSTDAASTLKMAKADAEKRLREQAEESARAIESAKKRRKKRV